MDYPLESKLDNNTTHFITSFIETSYNVKNIKIADDNISIDFIDIVSSDEFKKLMKKLLYISGSIDRDTLFENKAGNSYRENPMKYLEESKNVIKIADGMYMFQGMFLKVFRSLLKYLENLAAKYNAIDQEYPTLWPIDLFKKINYFKEFPQQVILTTTVKKSFGSRDKFANKYDNENDYDSVSIDDHMESCHFGLEPAVCDTCYYALSNETNYKNKIYTTYNKVFRNESSKINSLDRLKNFSVRDIMFVGDKEFVLNTRQRLIDDLIEFLKYLNLDSKIETANDPFFSNDSAMKNVFQYAFRLKYELLAKINFSNSYLAIGSINLHLDSFGKPFNIRLPDGSHAFSGCIGIGFERLAYALYCQYGHDVSSWPEDLKNKLQLD